uniref:Uncharacterized protein n=1 Tax=Romanomermis culicivorax TaxID=13658 RepID=A0A915L5E2_ROMCU
MFVLCTARLFTYNPGKTGFDRRGSFVDIMTLYASKKLKKIGGQTGHLLYYIDLYLWRAFAQIQRSSPGHLLTFSQRRERKSQDP